MKVLYSWLKELAPCDLPVEELAERMTMQGVSVEGIEYLGQGLEEVKVGQILTCDRHPNADRLTLCRVTDGSGEYSIVCGATNHKAGDKVALALPGTKLPGLEGKPLKKAKIRGVESFGMMCSERELGLSDEHAGIIILSADAPLGAPFAEAAGLDDYLIEFEITPNRGDCLSVLGIAREVAALLDAPVRLPAWEVHAPEPRDSGVSIETWDYDLCPRYCARVVEGVRIGPSPDWMRRRLEACGIRSINNVVDITNYVLLEFGHPLHAFDLDTLRGRKVIVRRAKPGELIVTIDEKKRTLDETHLVIADAEHPVALAGVMGGAETEVTDNTTNLLIESAYFNPVSIRKTSKNIGLSTEASYRFERGTDWKGQVWACERCARLLQELAGGKVVGELIDIQPEESSPHRLREETAPLRVPRLNHLLGIHLNLSETRTILQRLGFECRESGPESLDVHIPTHRGDVTREIDLIEEVARIYGYNRIRTVLPTSAGRTRQKAWRDTFVERIRAKMVALGFMDALNPSFIGPEHLERMRIAPGDSLRQAIPVLNPLSSNESLLRTSLLPSILEALGRNARRLNPRAALFEAARVYLPELPDPLRCERRVLSGGAYGPRGTGWLNPEGTFDFFDAKGVIEELLDFARMKDYRFVAEEAAFLQPGRSARLILGERQEGILGEVHPDVAEAFSLKERVVVFELDLEGLRQAAALSERRFSTPSPYPPVSRDLALIVDVRSSAGEIQKAIEETAGRLLESCYLYDVFTGGRMPAGKRSLAFRLVFRSPERTLTEEEVNRHQERLLQVLQKRFEATLPPS